MNFDWRDISRKDTEEFNQWSNSEDFKIKSKENTIDKYLHTNNYGGLGELIKMFLNVNFLIHLNYLLMIIKFHIINLIYIYI